MEKLIQQTAEKLAVAERLVFVTGAGVSKESGIPTFRDAADGIWQDFDPLLYGSPLGWAMQPGKVWNWYYERRQQMAEARPNPGHFAMRDLEALVPQVVVLTQNIDRLHHQAGSSDVVALHGDMFAYRCDRDCQGNPTPVDLDSVTWTPETAPPRCPHCKTGHVRPDVVWYGEYLLKANVDRALSAARQCDVMIVAGTSGAIPLAAHLPVYAREAGAFVADVNPSKSAITPTAHVWLAGPSGVVLPQVVQALRALKSQD